MRRILRNLPAHGAIALGALLFAVAFAANPVLLQPVQITANSLGRSVAPKSPQSSSYWYGGACDNDTRYLENSGARSMIEVSQQNVSGFLAFWVSESFSNNLWAQVGYYIYESSNPVGFYQVWNLTSQTEVSSGTGTVGEGFHYFSFVFTPDGMISFKIDERKFATYNVGQVTSGSSYPLCSLSEEGFAPAPFQFSPIIFKAAIQVLKSGIWLDAASASSFGGSWGIQGRSQNASLLPNQMVVGKNLNLIPSSSMLWS